MLFLSVQINYQDVALLFRKWQDAKVLYAKDSIAVARTSRGRILVLGTYIYYIYVPATCLYALANSGRLESRVYLGRISVGGGTQNLESYGRSGRSVSSIGVPIPRRVVNVTLQ